MSCCLDELKYIMLMQFRHGISGLGYVLFALWALPWIAIISYRAIFGLPRNDIQFDLKALSPAQ